MPSIDFTREELRQISYQLADAVGRFPSAFYSALEKVDQALAQPVSHPLFCDCAECTKALEGL